MADPLAAGEQRIGELQRLEMEIAIERLEPFGRVARTVLELEDLEVPCRDIFIHRSFEAEAGPVEDLRELDGVLERKLGARADREVRGMRRVAQQDDVAGVPPLALDAAEVEPCGR